MPPYLIAVFFCVLLMSIMLVILMRQRKGIFALRLERDALLREEHRMFHFLHGLGKAIEGDVTPTKLHRVIVNGVKQVIDTNGAALYLLDEARAELVPAYLSKDCPPLIGVPHEVIKKAKNRERAMRSHVRLAHVPMGEGILAACLDAGEAIWVEDLRSHPAFRDQLVTYEGSVAAMLAPLKHGGRDLGILAVADIKGEERFTQNDFEVFRSVAEQTAFALGNAMAHRDAAEKRRIERELNTAREVQQVLLPEEAPAFKNYRVMGKNVPARMISGDYYDYVDLGEGKHAIVIADVSGKGVSAGLLMAMCRSVLRTVAENQQTAKGILAEVNRLLFVDMKEDMFITLAIVLISEEEGTISLCRAGHDAPLLYRKESQQIEMLKPKGLAIGIDGGGVFERVTEEVTYEMAVGDCLLLYTDGIPEAVNSKGDEFGIDALKDIFKHEAPNGGKAIMQGIEKAVSAFSGSLRQNDDMTLLVIERR